jgi:hypothetical protein
VPFRARFKLGPGVAVSVGEELAIQGVGDPALEAPDRLERLLALGPLAAVVGAARAANEAEPRFDACQAGAGLDSYGSQ